MRHTDAGYTDQHPLSTNGKEVLISNGSNLENIGGAILTTDSSPYNISLTTTDFNQSFNGGGGITKITDDISISYGREGVIEKNGIEFLFDIGDIIVGDSAINFVNCSDTIPYSSASELNDLVRTEKFTLNQNSEFYFSDFYYVLNQDLADSLLTENDMVNFRVELVNQQTEEIIGTFDNITYSIYQLEKYDNISYQVDCSNITPGDYYLRLVTTVQGDAGYYLGKVQNNSEELNKRNYQKINFDGKILPTTYNLSQNYPNPFNPSTTINFQLPKSGFVTLKVFDILGREVATLVNKEKSQGRYSVNFSAKGGSASGGDALNLASGVYIYQIRVNDYVSSKKMILLK